MTAWPPTNPRSRSFLTTACLLPRTHPTSLFRATLALGFALGLCANLFMAAHWRCHWDPSWLGQREPSRGENGAAFDRYLETHTWRAPGECSAAEAAMCHMFGKERSFGALKAFKPLLHRVITGTNLEWSFISFP